MTDWGKPTSRSDLSVTRAFLREHPGVAVAFGVMMLLGAGASVAGWLRVDGPLRFGFSAFLVAVAALSFWQARPR